MYLPEVVFKGVIEVFVGMIETQGGRDEIDLDEENGQGVVGPLALVPNLNPDPDLRLPLNFELGAGNFFGANLGNQGGWTANAQNLAIMASMQAKILEQDQKIQELKHGFQKQQEILRDVMVFQKHFSASHEKLKRGVADHIILDPHVDATAFFDEMKQKLKAKKLRRKWPKLIAEGMF